MATIRDLINDLKKGQAAIREFNSTMPSEIAKKVETEIKKATPVDTGDLKDSIKSSASNTKIEWYSDSEYAKFVELGHLSRGGTFVEGAGMFTTGEKVIDSETDKQIKKLEKKLDSVWR